MPIRWLLFFFVFCSFFPGLTSCDFNRKERGETNFVLKVDDFEMTAKEFGENLVKKLMFFDPLSLREKSLVEAAKNRVIHESINKAVILKWARNHNVFVRKEELEKEIHFALKSYPDDLSFRKALIEARMSFEDWKKAVHFSLLQKLVHKKITKNLKALTEKNIRSYYKNHRKDFQRSEQVHLRQIVTKTENEAKLVMEGIQKGRSFKRMAQNFSITPESEKGGDLGWISRGILDVFDQAFKMRIGQRSSILRSSHGYHIYEVLGKKHRRILPLSQVRSRIVKILTEQKEQDVYSKWLKDQIKNVKIFVNQDLVKKVKVEIGA